MKKLIDISFNMHHTISKPDEVIEGHKEGNGYVHFLKKYFEIVVIEHINYEGSLIKERVNYCFFKSRNKFLHIPFKTLFYVRKEEPDIVLVQGTVFPFQVVMLRMFLAKQSQLIVQHHGNLPFKGIKKIFQQIADRCIDAYLFTAMGNVKIWLDNKIIKNEEKCFEVLEGSSYFIKQNKKESRAILQIDSDNIFLWVGRLDIEKDPITVLEGFEKYLHDGSDAKLYMIYQTENILLEVKAKIDSNPLLKNAVILVGRVAHEQLEHWYSAADFYLSGSHREGSGYALIESLACGCIPIVTDIPPFRKITSEHGFLFEQGKPEGLYLALIRATQISKEEYSSAIVNYFKENLSFKNIADDIFRACTNLTIK